ncbi:MAG TPA: MFS transporter, partial [Steroidobacter sp.]|nr:MFS transporter [Steroidobacter sp.]
MFAQIMMIFNISTLQVSMDAIAGSLGTAATTIGTAIVTYALVVAALILPGARVAQLIGSRRVFRASVALFGISMIVMAASLDVTLMIVAQVLAGMAAAALVPTLVVLVADNYRGQQQAKALGWLGAAPAMGIVLAFLLAGSLTGWVGWRAMFGLLAALALALLKFSDRLSAERRPSPVDIDWIGAALAGVGVVLISVGTSNLDSWGTLLARPDAPFATLDLSPAPLMVLIGVFLLQAFVHWSRRRRDQGADALVALEVVAGTSERAALLSIFIVSALASAITFLIPLYIQVVQGHGSFETALSVIPFSVASFIAAVMVVRLKSYFSPAHIGRYSFLLITVGLALLGATIRNDWSHSMVIFGMAVAGFGEGALVTLLFNVLVTASPRELAADVGSVRGVTNNLATAVGTALATALIIGLLDRSVHYELVHNSNLPSRVTAQVDLDNIAFVSNDRLQQVLAATAATPEQVAEAVRINTDARLLALKATFFALAGCALLAFFPAGAL